MSADAIALEPVRPISNKLLVAIALSLCVGLTSLGFTWLAMRLATNDQRPNTEALLRSELSARKERLHGYLSSVSRDLSNIADARVSGNMINDFVSAFELLEESAESTLQKAYITDNPNPIGLKDALIDARDGSEYSRTHAEFHDWFRTFSLSHEFYDVFLISTNGDVVYTVHKETDFASNLRTGDFRNTSLSDIFESVAENPKKDRVVFSDFAKYEPSNDAPAAFVGTPLNHDGEFKGALVVQLTTSPLNRMLRKSRVMGETGAAYIVGVDRRLRGSSNYITGVNMLDTRIDTASVDAALSNKAGVHPIENHSGVDVLSAYSPFSWMDVNWAVVLEMDESEVNQSLDEYLKWLLTASLIATVLAFAIGWIIAERESPEA